MMKSQKPSCSLFYYLPGLLLTLSIVLTVCPNACYMWSFSDGISFRLPKMNTVYPSQACTSCLLAHHPIDDESEQEYSSDASSKSSSDLQLISRRELLAAAGSAFMLGSAYFCLAPQSSPLTQVRLGQPILTESVLLNLLPLKGKRASALRQIQFEIENISALRTFRNVHHHRATENTSSSVHIPQYMWNHVVRVGTNAMSLLEESRNDLKPVFRDMDNANVQANRAEWGKLQYNQIYQALKCAVTAANNKNEIEVVEFQIIALYRLGCLGELLVPVFDFEVSPESHCESIPRLYGRAVVDVVLRKEMTSDTVLKDSDDNNNAKDAVASKVIGNLTLVVDGFSSPVNAGNFIDLCQRGFFDGLPLKFDMIEPVVSSNNNNTLPIAIGGGFRDGFIDPLTGKLRTVPLEVLRSVPLKGNMPFYGLIRNTWGFPMSHAVQSFRIPGAVATYHAPGKVNGGSSEFFWLREESLDSDGVFMVPEAEALDNTYSIFAYMVLDTNMLCAKLKPQKGVSYLIESTSISYGSDNIVVPKVANFAEKILSVQQQHDGECIE